MLFRSDSHTVSVASASGDLGALTATVVHDTTGGGAGSIAWNYTVPESVAATLAVGQVHTDTFTVTVSDGHGGTSVQNVTVTVIGTDEAPVVSVGPSDSASGAVTYTSSVQTSSGTLSFSDIDLSDAHTVSVSSPSGTFGSLTASMIADSTGGNTGAIAWHYSVSQSPDAPLAAGQTHTDTFAVTVSDGHGGTAVQNVSVTITGTAVAPIAVDDAIGIVTFDDTGVSQSTYTDTNGVAHNIITDVGYQFTDNGQGYSQNGDTAFGPDLTGFGTYVGDGVSTALVSFGYSYTATTISPTAIEMTRADGSAFAISAVNLTAYDSNADFGSINSVTSQVVVTGYFHGHQVAQQIGRAHV